MSILLRTLFQGVENARFAPDACDSQGNMQHQLLGGGQSSHEGSQRMTDRESRQENRREMHLELWSIQSLRLSFPIM